MMNSKEFNEMIVFLMKQNVPKIFDKIACMYKCYYEYEHCLEDKSPMNLLRSLFLPLKSYKRAKCLAISRQIRIYETFWKVLRHINAYVSNKWPLKSWVVEFWYRKHFHHYKEVFIHFSHSCSIFRCFGQLDFPSFSDHFE
ncbi:hypothetical protein T12_5093 [Trichinella patagoniensis]|uniref:Uncharacterized protein n=1 Tax=Trichinella patagoniensis TaxID=990121 RepID=A0A0V1ABC8_9BILA|nr:hypothetical protein T12_5093 [Trichinella patagoniensis]